MSGSHRNANLVSWKPGQSGNPGGKRPAALKLAQILAKETKDGQEIVEFVLGVLRGRTTEAPIGNGKRKRIKYWGDKSRIWAAEWCGDRLWGKAKQVIELESGTSQPQADYATLSDSDLAELERIMTKTITVGDQPDPALGVPGEIIPVEPGTSSDPE